MKNIISFLVMICFMAALFISSCEKDQNPDAPKLPPASSLILSTDNFNDPSDTLEKKSTQGSMIAHYYNWGHSLGVVAFWNTYLTINLAVPVFAYEEILKHTPKYLGENRWEWTVDFNHLNQIYTARLLAYRISNEEFKAEMYISRANGFTEFKWFEGTIRYDRTQAEWSMFESPDNNAKLFDIAWTKDWEKDSESIIYTYVKAGAPEKDSYIRYIFDPALGYNSSYEVKLSSNTTSIEWNKETLAGHVKDPERFKDSLWHCWNESLMDVACP